MSTLSCQIFQLLTVQLNKRITTHHNENKDETSSRKIYLKTMKSLNRKKGENGIMKPL